MGRLKSRIQPEFEDVGRPRTQAQLDFGDGPTPALAALVDTGSTLTLGPLFVLSEERRTAIMQTPRVALTGLGGDAHGYWAVGTLLIGSPVKIRLFGVRICLTASVEKMHQPILLGQRDFGERLRFVQLQTVQGRREFMLDEWKPKSRQ